MSAARPLKRTSPQPDNGAAASPARKAALVAAAAIVALALWQAPLAQWLVQASQWQVAHPVAAAALYVAFVALGTPAMVPGSVLMMTGGFLFGAVHGFALAAIGVAIGATLAFVIGQRFARDAVLRAAQTRPGFQSFFAGLEQALRVRGFLVVFLTRLSLLIPFTVLNYAYSVSSVAPSRYVLGTALGMLPAVALYVYLGSIAGNVDALLSGNAGGGPGGATIILAGVLVMVLVTWIIHRTATAELRKHMG